jgi:hypothetical protein
MGSSSICVEIGNFDGHHPRSEKLRACPAIHRAFNRFQAIDLARRLTIAPGPVDGFADGVDISAKNAGKNGLTMRAGINGFIDPFFEFPGSSATEYPAKHGKATQNS